MALRVTKRLKRLIFAWNGAVFNGGDVAWEWVVDDPANPAFVPIIQEDTQTIAGEVQPGVQLRTVMDDAEAQMLTDVANVKAERDAHAGRIQRLSDQVAGLGGDPVT